MRVRVELCSEQYINLDTSQVEVFCTKCNSWVKLDEVRSVTFPDDGCTMSECPKCSALSSFSHSAPEKDSPKNEFEPTPTEVYGKIVALLSHLPMLERQSVLKRLKG